jgi:NCAIR mutase (PurE)-related protein
MTPDEIRSTLESLLGGALSLDDAAAALDRSERSAYVEDALLDLDRFRRRGVPEVIYCASKSVEQIAAIIPALLAAHGLAFGTRCSPESADEVMKRIAGGTYSPVSRTIRFGEPLPADPEARVAVIAAGTSDLPVAEEACQTLETFGATPERLYDVGVAGLHRLLSRWDVVERASVLIVVAGMEGALPSVVGGLSRQPLIAVPTSVGYGTALGGLTPLMAMLTSCSSGISVVNIDNGFGAAMAALSIVRAIRERGGTDR